MPPDVEVGVGTVALACGVVSVHSPVKVLVLRNPDVRGKDLNGERAVGRLLSIGIEFCRGRVAGGIRRNHQLTCRTKTEESVRGGIGGASCQWWPRYI